MKSDKSELDYDQYSDIGPIPNISGEECSDNIQQKGGMDVEIKYKSWDMFERMWESKISNSFEKRSMWRCLQFCYLFPCEYEFLRDDMIQLWIVEEFASSEDSALLLFEDFEKVQIFLLSYLDHTTGRPRYKLNHSVFNLLQQRHENEYMRLEDEGSYVSDNILHASLYDTSTDQIIVKDLYQAEMLETLIIIHEQGSRVDHIPRELFLKLPLIRVLDLSNTNIRELPSSIGNLEHLRYLNLSRTPITMLPNSLCSLHQMQVLKLAGCLKLVSLPKGMATLINLTQLEVDVACLMVLMPPSFGNLTRLRKLPAFVVGKEKGCQITELKHMKNICGTLCILRLENVYSWVEAKDAALYEKISIDKLNLQWTESEDRFAFKVLENLQPHKQLQELQIVGFSSSKFPNWICNPLFSKLVTVTLYNCRNCEHLPPLGNLPTLKYLFVSNMHVVKTIDSRFCDRKIVAGPLDFGKLVLKTLFRRDDKMLKAFPRLENLTLNGMPMLDKWNGIKKGDFCQLQKLNICGCSKLKSLPLLSFLISLRQLEISLCPLLESFPSQMLPTSLETLVIIDCPLLKEWYHKKVVQDEKSSAYLSVWIDYQQSSRKFLAGQDEENETDDRINMLDTGESGKQETHTGNKSKVDSIPSGVVNSGFEKIPGSPLRVPGSPFRVPPSPSRFSISPQLSRIGSIHLNMGQVIKATQNFSPQLKIGEGGFGTVYRAQLQDGQIVAINRAKKEHINTLQAEFCSEVELLAKIEHRNLVRLLGCVDIGNERIIITEHVPNGTLREHLDGQHGKVLDFIQRLEISIDVADALTHLHLYAEKQIIHGDVKSSNILLTESFRAKVADSGFARLGPTENNVTHSLTTVKGTAGNLDPEYLRTYQVTPKSDVYSFGILIIEILTGRRPVEPLRVIHEKITVRWAFKNYKEGNVSGLLDPLLKEAVDMGILSKMLSLAFQCAAPTGLDRPDMKEVGERLRVIRMDYYLQCKERG